MDTVEWRKLQKRYRGRLELSLPWKHRFRLISSSWWRGSLHLGYRFGIPWYRSIVTRSLSCSVWIYRSHSSKHLALSVRPDHKLPSLISKIPARQRLLSTTDSTHLMIISLPTLNLSMRIILSSGPRGRILFSKISQKIVSLRSLI